MVPVWLLLIPFLVIYCVKEVFIMGMYKRKLKYLRRMSSYRNISIILSTVALIYDGPPDHVNLPRWHFPLVSLTCLFLWLETTTLAGKIPKYGIYIHMFW